MNWAILVVITKAQKIKNAVKEKTVYGFKNQRMDTSAATKKKPEYLAKMDWKHTKMDKH